MTLNIAIHKNLCVKILKDIFSDSTVGPYLGFKGGTAALLFYGLSRFSVDLDFDLLNVDHTEAVFERLEVILRQYGKLKDAKDKRFTLLFHLSYDEKATLAENIKVEINKRSFGSRYVVKEYLGIAMKVMVKEDMAAHKMIAMLNRIGKANRDIYDVWYFLSNNWSVNKQLIEEITGLTYKKFLEECITALSQMSNNRILDGLGLLLTPEQKTWAKANLLKETIFLLKLAQSNEA